MLYDKLFPLVDYIKSNNPNIILSITTTGKIINENSVKEIIKRLLNCNYPTK